MRFKNLIIFTFIFSILLITGCKPYFMLDDKGKIQRIIEKYVQYLNSGKFDESFKLLTFVHDPKSRNFEMYKMAQTFMSNNYESTEYILKKIDIKNNTASVELDMVFSSENPVPRKVKVESQLFMYKPENSKIWFIASGNQDSRKKFLEKIKESEGLGLIEDKTFYSWKGKWIEENKIRFENGKTYILDKDKWIEQ